MIKTPAAADILCGKDKTFGQHPGNLIYRDLIVAKALDYAAATSKQDKMLMTAEIVSTLYCEHGSRFLKKASSNGNGDGWEQLTAVQARDKTSHALRFYTTHTVPIRQARVSFSTKLARRVQGRRRGGGDDKFNNDQNQWRNTDCEGDDDDDDDDTTRTSMSSSNSTFSRGTVPSLRFQTPTTARGDTVLGEVMMEQPVHGDHHHHPLHCTDHRILPSHPHTGGCGDDDDDNDRVVEQQPVVGHVAHMLVASNEYGLDPALWSFSLPWEDRDDLFSL